MPAIAEMKCACCDAPLERMRYFPRQMLTADDMRVEQEYFREKLRRHNRYLHGWGVVCGCTVEWVTDARAWQVRVCPGYLVGPQGDEIWIDECVDVDLKTGVHEPPCATRWPCPPVGATATPAHDGLTRLFIAVRYAECESRPVRVHPSGCGCDETGCEYSRTRESFEIKVLHELPKSHVDAKIDDDKWCQTNTTPPAMMLRNHLFPVPPCPECVAEPWVVLATVMFPADANPTATSSGSATINYLNRRVLLSTQRLQVATICLP